MKVINVFIKGDKKTAKFLHKFETNLLITTDNIARELTKEVWKKARSYAPRDTGRLHDAIAWKKVKSGENSEYKIYLHKIHPHSVEADPNGKSKKSHKIYPIAQEKGYKAHYIRKGWAHPNSYFRAPYNNPWSARKVSKHTPYMLPAVLRVQHGAKAVIQKAIKKTIKNSRR